MNGFKKFIYFKNVEIHYKILNDDSFDVPKIVFVMSYPDEDIWGDNNRDDMGMFYKKIFIDRNDWMEVRGYKNIDWVISDFVDALSEFKSNKSWEDYSTKINKHFIKEAKKQIELLNKKLKPNKVIDNEILGMNGFGDTMSISSERVEVCKKWIKKWITPRKTINEEMGSYKLKHAVEKDVKDHVPNGAFIKAALELGYDYRIEGPNAYFNMSFVALKKKEEVEREIEILLSEQPKNKEALEKLKKYTKTLIQKLEPRDQRILEMRFGLKDGVMHSFMEISKELNIATIEIEGIIENSLEKIMELDINQDIDDRDELYDEAKELVVGYQKASSDFLQRKLKIGQARAVLILSQLEKLGIISSAKEDGTRDVLVDAFSGNRKNNVKDVLSEGGYIKRAGDNIQPGIGVKDLSREIANILIDMNENRGAIFGIFGSWGRGKTFLMRQIREETVIKKNYISVDFHAWKYQDTPASWAYLYECLFNSYIDKKNEVDFSLFGINYKVKNSFLKIIKLNSKKYKAWPLLFIILQILLSYLCSQVIGWTSIINVVGASLFLWSIVAFILYGTRLIKNISRYFLAFNYSQYFGVQHIIQKEIKILLNQWLDGKKLLILVDDIDRCDEKKIISIIDSFRVMLEDVDVYKKITVVIAVDERILSTAIRHKYKDLVGDQKGKDDNSLDLDVITREYMDKLFLCGIKLDNLTDNEKLEILNNLTKNMMMPEEEEYDTEFSKEDKLASQPTAREVEQEEKSEREVMKHQIRLEEKASLVVNIRDVEKITPRQEDIFVFRYLLARNLLRIKGIQNVESNDICIELANYLNTGKLNVHGNLDDEVENVLRMVVTY